MTTEAAGYIGYYSGATLWDYPGLTSRRSSELIRSLPREERTIQALIDRLHPEWLALRPSEWEELRRRYPVTAACYTSRMTFGTPGEDTVELNGLTMWNPDRSFAAFQRTSCAAQSVNRASEADTSLLRSIQ